MHTRIGHLPHACRAAASAALVLFALDRARPRARDAVLFVLFAAVLSAGLQAESVAGVRWTAPPAWKNLGATPMRAATYAVPGAPGDSRPSECVVYFFGVGQGGPVDLNIERWKSQFTDKAGKPAHATVGRREIRGMKTTTIDVSGEYSGLGGPTGPARVASGYRLLGAILEGPGGNVFVKFTGPQAGVTAAQGQFEKMLASFDRMDGDVPTGSRPRPGR